MNLGRREEKFLENYEKIFHFKLDYLCSSPSNAKVYFTYLNFDWEEGMFSTTEKLEFSDKTRFTKKKNYLKKIGTFRQVAPISVSKIDAPKKKFVTTLKKAVRKYRRYKRSGTDSFQGFTNESLLMI